MTDHDRMDELAAGYALHALTPEDESQFEAHLETCPDCAARLKDYEFVAAQLGSMAHYQEHDDSPSWESVRAAVRDASASSGEVAELGTHRRRLARSQRLLAAAAALVLLAGGGIAIWRLASNGSNSTCTVAAGCHVVHLDATGGKTLAAVTVRGDTATVTPTAMPAAPSGKVYVLWQQPRGGGATAIGEFTAGSSGPSATGGLVAPYADTKGFAVSLEAAGPPPDTPSNLLASGTAG
jgi:anti-sigma-K factor RskA